MSKKETMTEVQKFGYFGEKAFECRAVGLGYQVVPYSANFQSPYDFMLEGVLPVEVKSARPKLYWVRKKGYLRWRWQFNLTSVNLRLGQPDFILALGCWIASQQAFDYFLIPSAHFLGRPVMAQITTTPSLYRGWMSGFYDCWSSIDMLVHRARYGVNYSMFGGEK